MLLLDDMELTQENLKRTRKPCEKRFFLRKESTVYKQAVVRTLSNLNYKNIAYAMFYIAKHSENFIVKDEKGNQVKVSDVLKDWQKNMKKDLKSNEAMHLFFSIDEFKTAKNLEALEQSVDEVLRHNFYEYKHISIPHKHQGKPHVHVIINKRSKFTNKKMHFNDKKEIRDFYKNLRDEFAENLNHYNENFNYRSDYKVERDLKYQMLSKTVKDIKKKSTLSNRIITEATENINQYEVELENINTRIEINLKEKIETNVNEPKKTIKKINIILKRNKSLTRIQKDIKCNIEKQKKIITAAEFIIKEAATKNFVTVEHTIKFFNSQMNKRNMTLKQFFGVEELKKDFKELKHFYNIQVGQELTNEKDEIQRLCMTTNAFKIYKLYKQVIRREFENDTVLENDESKKIIDSNKNLLQKIFKERDIEIEIMQRKAERTIEQFKDKNSFLKEQKEKELGFLKEERIFINQLKEFNHGLVLNSFDKLRYLKNFKVTVKNITNKTSIFQLEKIIIQREYLVEKTNSKEGFDYLSRVEKDLKNLIDKRAFKNYRTVQYLKEKLKTSETIKDKNGTIKTLEFLKKEKELINKIYEDTFTQNDKDGFIAELSKSINLIDDTKSIYRIKILEDERKFRTKLYLPNKENIDTLKNMKKDIRFKTLMRESKVKKSLDYFVGKLNDAELKTKEINKIKNTINYLKKESKDIGEFKQSQVNEFGQVQVHNNSNEMGR